MVLPMGSGTADTTVADLARFDLLKLDDDLAHGPGEVIVDPRHTRPILPFEAVHTDGEARYGSQVITLQDDSKNDLERQCLCRR